MTADRRSGWLAAVLALAVAWGAVAVERPNIILVFIDDMGWGDFSCFGNTEAQTPNIDRLAAEGIRFEQFYVNSPICSPSRTAISTGQYPQRWRIGSYLDNRARNRARGVAQWLAPKAPMLARSLKEAGYATGHFGKWHMGGQRDVDDAPLITEYGFDESLTNFEGMGPKLLPLTLKPGQAEPGKIWGDAERLGKPVTWMLRAEITGGFVRAALDFVGRAVREKKPFYINLWPDDVHSPYWPPVGKWADGKRGLYLSVLQEADRQLGALFSAVRDNPAVRDNTLILVCSDNGPEQGAGRAGPFRGGKGMLYEGGLRSPLVVWGPGLVNVKKAGTANRASVMAAIDLVPTLLAVAGVKPPEGVAYDGVALKDTLLGASDAARDRPLFFRRPPDRGAFAGETDLPDLAVREGKWKLLCEYDGSKPQLYDVEADPGEKANLAASEVETAARLARAVVGWHGSLPPDGAEKR